MSLINQALRKVQSQRAANQSTLGNNQPGVPYAYQTARTNRTGLLVGLSICVVVLIGLIAGLTFVLLSKYSAPATPAIAKTTEPEAQIQTSIPDTTVAPPSNPETTATTEPLPSTGQTVAPSPSDEETLVEIETEVLPNEPNQEIIEWLAQSTVFGIRISKNGSKAILNNKAFTNGETVNFDLDLKILLIEEGRILFIDRNGLEYTKRF